MAASLANACKDKEGSSDADVATFLAHDLPTTPGGKCLCACVMETIGVVSIREFGCLSCLLAFLNVDSKKCIATTFRSIDFQYLILTQIKDGKPSHEGAIEITKKVHPGDDKAIAVTNQIAADCAGIADGDRCELAFKMIECTRESMVKQGLDPKQI